MYHYTVTIHKNLPAKKKKSLLFVSDAELNFYYFLFRIEILNLTIAQKDSMMTSVSFYNYLVITMIFYYKIFYLKIKTNNINV